MVSSLITLLLLGVAIPLAEARVTFTHSEVLQEGDLSASTRAPFKCVNGCSAYSDSLSTTLFITKYNEQTKAYDAVVDFSSMVGGSVLFAREPYNLTSSNSYFIEKRGETDPFVFYVVDSKAPNFNTPVLVKMPGNLDIHGPSRLVTVLYNVVERDMYHSHFSGAFQPGYPRIYATGFDAVSEEECRPLYQARSQETAARSQILLSLPIGTVDFGSEGEHGVSIVRWHEPGSSEEFGTTNVYASAGYVGCSYNQNQIYYIDQTGYENLPTAFSVTVKTLDLEISTFGDELIVHVNDEQLDHFGASSTKKHYENDEFDVSINWSPKSPGASFAIQVDFGDKFETTTKGAHGLFAIASLFSVVFILLQ